MLWINCKHFSNVFTFILYSEACSHNLRARMKGMFFGFLGLLLPFVLLVNFLASSSVRGTLEGLVGKGVSEELHVFTVSINRTSKHKITTVSALQYGP